MNQYVFGRRYRLTVQAALPGGNVEDIIVSDSSWEPEALRFAFDVEKSLHAFWNGVVTVYNCDGPIPGGPYAGLRLSDVVIVEGMRVKIEAGYQGEPLGEIWNGEIFQPLWERVNVVDFTLTLRCIEGKLLGKNGLINETLPALITTRKQAEQIAVQSSVPIPFTEAALAPLDDTQASASIRPITIFSNPYDAIKRLAREGGNATWFDQKGVNVGSLTSHLGPVVARYAPPFSPGSTPQSPPPGFSLTMVGAPRQTRFGVDWTVLLDARMNVTAPLSQAVIDMAAVTMAKLPVPFSSATAVPPFPLAKNAQYIVVQVRHRGDTRGAYWHTEVTGVEAPKSVALFLGGGSLDPFSQ